MVWQNLPEGQMGNSEVGHINMGVKNRISELTRITKEIQDGTFFQNAALLSAIDNCKRHNSDLHLYGLLSMVFIAITPIYIITTTKNKELVYMFMHFRWWDTPSLEKDLLKHYWNR